MRIFQTLSAASDETSTIVFLTEHFFCLQQAYSFDIPPLPVHGLRGRYRVRVGVTYPFCSYLQSIRRPVSPLSSSDAV